MRLNPNLLDLRFLKLKTLIIKVLLCDGYVMD